MRDGEGMMLALYVFHFNRPCCIYSTMIFRLYSMFFLSIVEFRVFFPLFLLSQFLSNVFVCLFIVLKFYL